MEPRINWRSHLHWHSPDCSSVRSDTRRPTATVAENVEASRGSSPCPTLPPKYVLIRHDFAAARQYCNDVIFSPISKETVYRPLSSRPSNDFPHTSKYSHGGGEGGEGGNLKGSLTLSGGRAGGRSVGPRCKFVLSLLPLIRTPPPPLPPPQVTRKRRGTLRCAAAAAARATLSLSFFFSPPPPTLHKPRHALFSLPLIVYLPNLTTVARAAPFFGDEEIESFRANEYHHRMRQELAPSMNLTMF